jgi:hypothetical protein
MLVEVRAIVARRLIVLRQQVGEHGEVLMRVFMRMGVLMFMPVFVSVHVFMGVRVTLTGSAMFNCQATTTIPAHDAPPPA